MERKGKEGGLKIGKKYDSPESAQSTALRTFNVPLVSVRYFCQS